jgi:flagellar biosynthesis protein FlhG
MSDQAELLRNLVQAAPDVGAKPQLAGTPLVALTGSRTGVGVTTATANIGVALADRGARVLVVDATRERSNMMEIAGARSAGKFTLADALVGKCHIADALVDGPGGMKLLEARRGSFANRKPKSRTDAAKTFSSPWRIGDRNGAATGKELLAVLSSLRAGFDVMLVDTGAGLSQLAQRLWLRAHLVVLVTTSDDAAVMDAYAAAKQHVIGARDASCGNIRLLVNQSENERLADDAHRRLSNCCQRFLQQRMAALPALPRFRNGEDTGVALHPRVWEAPNSDFGHAVLWLARAVEDLLTIEDAGHGKQGLAESFPTTSILHPVIC